MLSPPQVPARIGPECLFLTPSPGQLLLVIHNLLQNILLVMKKSGHLTSLLEPGSHFPQQQPETLQ